MENIIDKVAFIEIKDRKILETKNFGKNAWYLPGGKREKDETDQQTLVREMKEELLVDIIPESLVMYGVFEAQADGKPIGMIVRMTCYTGTYTGELKPSAEVEKMDWFDSSKINEISEVDKLIFEDLKMRKLID